MRNATSSRTACASGTSSRNCPASCAELERVVGGEHHTVGSKCGERAVQRLGRANSGRRHHDILPDVVRRPLGAYILFAFAILAGLSPLWAIPLAGIIAAIVAMPVAGLVFRLRGHYFAIGTWIIAEVFRLLASQVSVLGGGSGISLPASLVIAIASSRQWRDFIEYWIALALVVAVLALIVLLLRSRYGLALKAIRDSELAATCNGIDVLRTKVLVYIITAAATAMVGAFIFLQRLRISPDAAFSVNDWTAFVIFITVIGGIGRIEGPIVGTIVFFALRQTLADLGTIYLLTLGVVAILVMLMAPKGIWGLIVESFGWQVFPLERSVILGDRRVVSEQKSGG